MINEIFRSFFTIAWIVVLVVFLFYFGTTVIFRALSYHFDWHYFAGNQRVQKIDPKLKYYIIIPCFNEGAIIVRTLKKVLAFPQVEAIIVDDASSDDSVAQIKQIDNPHLHLLRRYEPNAHTGKGDVLNFGLDYIRGEVKRNNEDPDKTIIGVIDADAQLASNAIDCLNKYFSTPNTVITQMRVKMYSHFKNILQVFQDVEFFSVNHMAQIMRMYTHTVGLSGNGQFFRLKPVMEKVGVHPWGQALLDDYELTIRLMAVGITVDYMTDTYVYQEALTSVKKFIRQRGRWAQGDLDCLRYLPQIIKSKTIKKTQKLGIYYFLARPWLSITADFTIIIMTILTIGDTINNFGRDHMSWLELVTILLTLLVISCLCGVIELILYEYDLHHFHEQKPKSSAMAAIIFIVSYIYAVLFFSLIIAFWRWLHHQDSWEKTDHSVDLPQN